jgi:hypothetical protein
VPADLPLLAAVRPLGLISVVLRPFLAHPSWARPRSRASLSSGFRGRSFRLAAHNAKSHDPRTDWPSIAVSVCGLFGVGDQLTGRADVLEFGRLPDASVTTFAEPCTWPTSSSPRRPSAGFDDPWRRLAPWCRGNCMTEPEVVEIGVHGVSGTPPRICSMSRSLRSRPATPKLASEAGLSDEERDPRTVAGKPATTGPRPEGCAWGGLTSGVPSRAFVAVAASVHSAQRRAAAAPRRSVSGQPPPCRGRIISRRRRPSGCRVRRHRERVVTTSCWSLQSVFVRLSKDG